MYEGSMGIQHKVMAERVGNRIHLRSQFKDKDICKSVIGARWSAKDRVWTYPLDMETCRRLRDAFGDRLVICKLLWEWAAEERKREQHLGGLTNVKDIDVMATVDLPGVRSRAPYMWNAMQNRPYQPVAAYYMALAKRCLNGDQPGIGKTIETLGALVEQDITGPILILAPKTSCLTVWPAEIENWLRDVPHTITQTAGLSAAKQQAAYEEYTIKCNTRMGMHFLIANAEQVRVKKFTECPKGICDGDEDWCPEKASHRNRSDVKRPFLHSVEWSAIVADETHKWLINTRGKSASQVGYGFTKLRVVEDGPMYALSGTPLKGKKHNLFGTLNWLWPKTYTSKWRWIESYFEVTVNDHGGREIGKEWRSSASKESFFRALKSVMIRRTKAELRAINPAWMPPEKRYHDVWVHLEGTQATHYKQMWKNAAATIEGGRLQANGILAEMTRLKQMALCDLEMVNGQVRPKLPSAKFDWLMQFLEERGIEPNGDLSDDVQKVVVASQFTSVLNLFSAVLADKGIDHVMITGETKDKVRHVSQRTFQTDDRVRVCLINTNAGGVSITLDAADDMVILDETWVPDEQEQVEDRVHRASNVTHQVDIWYVRAYSTIEEDIAEATEEKASSNHIVLDAQRGLRFIHKYLGVTNV